MKQTKKSIKKLAIVAGVLIIASAVALGAILTFFWGSSNTVEVDQSMWATIENQNTSTKPYFHCSE